MRGTFSLTFSLGLALLLVQASSAQNVSIELTPITYPIVLPETGGSFDYLLFVTNQGSTPITATIWCMVTLPNDSSWGPVVGPMTQILAAGQTQGFYRTQVIPPRAPFGYYTLTAKVGIYPDSVWDSDSFQFEKTAEGGTELWVARYDGPAGDDDWANGLAVDGQGNAYVAGLSVGNGTMRDYATIKYNSNGQPQWISRYNGSANEDDMAMALALDGAGNVYVTGWSDCSGTGFDIVTIKYDPGGQQQWISQYNGPANSTDQATALALDAAGNVYVAGTSYGLGTNWDYATFKYNSSGEQQWAGQYDGPGNSLDLAKDIAVDGAGNVYVTGRSTGSGTYTDYATLKYGWNGEHLWIARYNGPGSGHDYAEALALDEEGNVYVTGGSDGAGGYWDYATIKYDTEGQVQWISCYSGPGNSSDHAYALALDGANNVYVTGESDVSGSSEDYATVMYNSAGEQQWVARYNGPANNIDEASALALDEAGNVYVTGRSYGTGTSYDYATIMYNSAGEQQWAARYDGPTYSDDRAYAVAADGSGHVYVTGRSAPYENYDYATVKYSGGEMPWMPVEALVLGQPLPQEFALHQNYPNPFNASTAISYELRAASFVSLKIYNTAGRLVETLVDGWRSAGSHELTFDAGDLPSGMYIYRMTADALDASGKMVLMK